MAPAWLSYKKDKQRERATVIEGETKWKIEGERERKSER